MYFACVLHPFSAVVLFINCALTWLACQLEISYAWKRGAKMQATHSKRTGCVDSEYVSLRYQINLQVEIYW